MAFNSDNIIQKDLIKATGPGGPKIISSLSKESDWAVKDVEDHTGPHQKILFQARVMIFWKSGFGCNLPVSVKT